MPTGYTAELCEREQSFEEFVWTCARGMGAMIMQRDDALGVARIEPEKPSEFYINRIRSDEDELRRVSSLSKEACNEEAEREYAERLRHFMSARDEARAVRERLEAMRAKVYAWKPPSNEHEGLRGFMLEQLDETIKWDGRSFVDPPFRKTGDEWRAEKVRSIKSSIESTRETFEKEKRAVESRNRWVEQLRASVKHPSDANVR